MQILFTYLAGLLSGIVVSAAGVYFHRLSDRRKKQDELQFQIYMRLMELSGAHFWIASHAASKEQPTPEQAKRFDDLRWRIADLLRQTDSLSEMSDILSVMFSARFASERERATEIDRLLKQIGDRVNPCYNRAIKEIDAENQRILAENLDEYVRRQRRLEP